MKPTVAIAPFVCAAVVFQISTAPSLAQITSAADGTNTIVNQAGSTFNINGGTQAGSNLFHSFQQFGLNQGQIATFLSNPSVQNILGRVTGGEASIINGQIQVTGSQANLFLMNPAGIVFGASASLNVPASFTATTANAIGFRPGPDGYPSGWFNAVGNNDYNALIGAPSSFVFSMPQPGAIANAGQLAVNQGNLALLAGTVVNNGTLSATEGEVIVGSVPGESYVRWGQAGSILTLDLPIAIQNQVNPLPFTPPTLPQLLTGGNLGNATGLTVENGVVKLTGSGLTVNPGDVVAKNVNAQTATLSAHQNLTLVESQLQTNGDLNLLARNTLTVRDSVTQPVVIQAGNNLTLQGNQSIDLFALNHPEPAFRSGGNLSLISNGPISGDAHYASGGGFSMRNLAGGPATFLSWYDPIISANGDVTFGDYTGVSLKVEATGNITTGNIQITGNDPAFVAAPAGSDRRLLGDYSAIILRAGVAALEETSFATNPSANAPFTVDAEGTTFNGTAPAGSTGRVTVGNAADPSQYSIQAEYIDISAPNGIVINTPIRANYVKLAATSGDVIVHSIATDFATDALSGDIDITAGNIFQATGSLETVGFSGSSTGLKNYILIDPNLVPFLVNKTGDTSANVEAAIQASEPSDIKMFSNEPVSISAGIGTINIRYGGGGPTTTLSPGVTLQGGNTPFVIGPNITAGAGDPYLPQDPTDDFANFVAAPFRLVKNENYSLATIPLGSSGTVGAITRTVVIDGSLTVAVQNQVLGATPTLPTQPTNQPVLTQQPTTTSTPSTIAAPNATAEISVSTVAQQSVQRTFVNQNRSVTCEATGTAIATANDGTRSGPSATAAPCTQAAGDDEQILKVLGEDVTGN